MEGVNSLLKKVRALFPMRRTSCRLNAVHPNEMKDVLESLGKLSQIQEGLIYCHDCDKELSIDSIGKILSEDENIIFYCDHFGCMFDTFRDTTDDVPKGEINYDFESRWTPERKMDSEGGETAEDQERVLIMDQDSKKDTNEPKTT